MASPIDNCYTDMGKDAQWTNGSPQVPVLNICRLLMLKPSKSAFAIASAFLLSLLFFLQLPWNPSLATPNTMDDFFGADTWRVLENLKDSDLVAHHRDRVIGVLVNRGLHEKLSSTASGITFLPPVLAVRPKSACAKLFYGQITNKGRITPVFSRTRDCNSTLKATPRSGSGSCSVLV
jgi:hypothetical protein